MIQSLKRKWRSRQCGNVEHKEPDIKTWSLESDSEDHLSNTNDLGQNFQKSTSNKKKLLQQCKPCKTPRFSCLSKQEHRSYLDLLQKYSSKVVQCPTEAEKAEIKELADLHSKVVTEQQEFSEHLRSSVRQWSKAFLYIHPEAERYVKELKRSKFCRAYRYNRYLVTDRVLPFPNGPMQKVAFEQLQTILQLGRLPRLVLPSLDRKCILPLDYSKITKRFPVPDFSNTKHYNQVHPSKKLMNEDTIAENLARKYNADVVLSLSALKTLLNNQKPHFDQQWELPIIIKNKEEGDGQNKQKIVCVDSPITTDMTCCRELNTLFHNYSLRVQFTHFNPSRMRRMKTVTDGDIKDVEVNQDLSRVENSVADDVFDDEVNSISNLETFGGSDCCHASQTNPQTSEKKHRLVESGRRDCDSEDLFGSQKTNIGQNEEHKHSIHTHFTTGEDIEMNQKRQDIHSKKHGDEPQLTQSLYSNLSESDLQQKSCDYDTGTEISQKNSHHNIEQLALNTSEEKREDQLPADEHNVTELVTCMDSDSDGLIIDLENKDDKDSNNTKQNICDVRENSLSLIQSDSDSNELVIDDEDRDKNSTENIYLVENNKCIQNNSLQNKAQPSDEMSVETKPCFLEDNLSNSSELKSSGLKGEEHHKNFEEVGCCQTVTRSDLNTEVRVNHNPLQNQHSDNPDISPNIEEPQLSLVSKCQGKSLPLLASPYRRVTRSQTKKSEVDIMPKLELGKQSKILQQSNEKTKVTEPVQPRRVSARLRRQSQRLSSASEDEGTLVRRSGFSPPKNFRRSKKHLLSEGSTKKSTHPNLTETGAAVGSGLACELGDNTNSNCPVRSSSCNIENLGKQTYSGSENDLVVEEMEKNDKNDSKQNQKSSKLNLSTEVTKSDEVKGQNKQHNNNNSSQLGSSSNLRFNQELNRSASAGFHFSLEDEDQSLQSSNEVKQSSDVKNKQRIVSASSTLDEILTLQERMFKKDGDKQSSWTSTLTVSQEVVCYLLLSGVEDPSEYPPMEPFENVVYSLWQLENLKLLLRRTLDCVRSPSNKPWNLFPKLEYLPQYGGEITTPSELCHQWVDLLTLPNSHLLQVRINALNSEVLLKEEKSLSEILASPKINTEECLQFLHHIMVFLTSLPIGQYFLSHQKGEKIMILFKALDSTHRGAFDLHTRINQKLSTLDDYQDVTRGELQWLPLDPEVILPAFQQQRRIPVTFPPKLQSHTVMFLRSVHRVESNPKFYVITIRSKGMPDLMAVISKEVISVIHWFEYKTNWNF
ncbi:uncharacterized protein LOC143252455 isoform X4 [Tachypleus tridentatus]